MELWECKQGQVPLSLYPLVYLTTANYMLYILYAYISTDGVRVAWSSAVSPHQIKPVSQLVRPTLVRTRSTTTTPAAVTSPSIPPFMGFCPLTIFVGGYYWWYKPELTELKQSQSVLIIEHKV